jgi:hypothetical protein
MLMCCRRLSSMRRVLPAVRKPKPPDADRLQGAELHDRHRGAERADRALKAAVRCALASHRFDAAGATAVSDTRLDVRTGLGSLPVAILEHQRPHQITGQPA